VVLRTARQDLPGRLDEAHHDEDDHRPLDPPSHARSTEEGNGLDLLRSMLGQ